MGKINFNTTLKEPTEELKMAMASLLPMPEKNRNIAWGSFVLLDDLPNGNGVRIPLEEFDNVIKSAEYMPLKMEFGTIKGKHEGSQPLGVIARLVKQVDSVLGNKIFGIAGLWLKERPNDIVALREAIAKNEGVDISWELEYINEDLAEDGILNLRDIGVTAATIVGNPAYQGRTPMFEIAEQNKNSEDDKTLDDKELIQQKYSELETKFQESETKLAEATKLLSEKTAEVEALTAKVAELQEFKDSVDKEKADADKLEAIKAKFTEYGLEKSDDYFAEKKDFLLGLEDTELTFMLDELKAVKPATSTEASQSIVPNLGAGNTGGVTSDDLLAYLKNRKSK